MRAATYVPAAAGALALAAACADNPTAPGRSAAPAAGAAATVQPSRSVTGGGSQLTFMTDSGTFTLALRRPDL